MLGWYSICLFLSFVSISLILYMLGTGSTVKNKFARVRTYSTIHAIISAAALLFDCSSISSIRVSYLFSLSIAVILVLTRYLVKGHEKLKQDSERNFNLLKHFVPSDETPLDPSTAEAVEKLASLPSYVPPYFKIRSGCRLSLENLSSTSHAVWDISTCIDEAPAIGEAGLRTIEIGAIFSPGTVFIGFGLPNVYTAQVLSDTDVIKVDAKSLHRAPTAIVHTDGRVQSGIFIVPTNLSEEVVAKIAELATKAVGEKHATCVHANTLILGEAGFSIGGRPISSYILPTSLLLDLLSFGIELNGTPIHFDIIRSSPLSLSDFYGKLYDAMKTTPYRHLLRHKDTPDNKRTRAEEAKRVKEANKVKLASSSSLSSSSLSSSSSAAAAVDARFFSLSVSSASPVGEFFRRLWGAHPIYRLDFITHSLAHSLSDNLVSTTINRLFPVPLRAFPHTHPSLATRVKKRVLFNRTVIKFMREKMAQRFKMMLLPGEVTEKQFIDLLLTHDSDLSDSHSHNNNVYNLVVTSTHMFLVCNSVQYGIVDWVLSKHVLVSGYSDDVRFAGELWKDRAGIIHINGDSGTYLPKEEDVDKALELAKLLFPNLPIKAEHTKR